MEKADVHQAHHDLSLQRYICLLHRNAKNVILQRCENIIFEIYFMHPIFSNISLFFNATTIIWNEAHTCKDFQFVNNIKF